MSTNSAFVFPPPPPPPPKASGPALVYHGAPQSYTQQNGHVSRAHHQRGSRGRGRGDGPNGSRGSFAHRGSNSPPAPGFSGAYSHRSPHPRPAYPTPGHGGFAPTGTPQTAPSQAWAQSQQAGATKAHHPQPNMTYTPQQFPSQNLYNHPSPSFPQGSQQSFNSAFPASTQGAEPPRPPYVNGYGAAQTQQAIHLQGQVPLMGPPIRMGFDQHHYRGGQQSQSTSLPPEQTQNLHSRHDSNPRHVADSHSLSSDGTFGSQSQTSYIPSTHGSFDRSGPRHSYHRGGNSHQHGHRGSYRKPQNTGPRPKAAPAVPSFLSATLPPRPPSVDRGTGVNGQARKKKKRKHNVLGLTPRTEEHEESEDEDVDEEVAHAAVNSGAQPLKFEYKGQTSTLGTPAEICAWIEERKKRFPTQARIEAKKAERDRQLQEARLKGKEALYEKRSKKAKRSAESAEKLTEEAELAKKRDRVRKRLREHERKLAKLDAEVARSEAGTKEEGESKTKKRKLSDSHGQGHTSAQESEAKSHLVTEIENKAKDNANSSVEESTGPTATIEDPTIEAQCTIDRTTGSAPQSKDLSLNENMDSGLSMSSDSMSLTSDEDDETSSSGSSSDSDNEPPEESSTHRAGPERVPPPKREMPICRQFLSTGRCSFGGRKGGCRYRHELPKRENGQVRARNNKQTAVKGKEKPKRKGLYQRMLENDREKEDIQILKAIKHLGDNGVLDEVTNRGTEQG